MLHYECFTDAYFFFGLVDVDSPQILLRFKMISLVSSMLPGSGFFRPKSLKSLAFLDLLRSSLMDFLKGGFFSLIVYILILEVNKVKRLCRQNPVLQGLVWYHHYMLWSIPGADTRCCGLMLRSEFGPPFEYRSVCALVWSNLTLFLVSGSGVCSGLYYYNMIRGEICQPLSAFWPHLFLTICCGGRGGETQEEFRPSGA